MSHDFESAIGELPISEPTDRRGILSGALLEPFALLLDEEKIAHGWRFRERCAVDIPLGKLPRLGWDGCYSSRYRGNFGSVVGSRHSCTHPAR
jgi:hypothetical protein